MTNKRIQLSTNVDGQNVNVYPVTKSEFVEFSDGKTLNDKLNNMDGNHEHGLATPAKDGFMSKEDKAKLDGVNNYTHPSTHAATMITEDATHRFVTDAEKTKWNNKADTTMASKTNAGLMSASDKQRIDGLNAEFKTRDDKITKNTEDIKSWNDEMINKEYQYFNGENIAIDNSIVSKTTDMVIKGKTLQNLIKDGRGTFTIDKSINEYSRIKEFKTTLPLKVGKEYTGYLVVDNLENSERWLSIYGYKKDDTTASIYGNVRKKNDLGVVKFTWTPNNGNIDTFDTIGIYIESTDFNNGAKATFSDFMLFEEGTDLTNIDKYFEGIKSFGQEEGKINTISHNKNLLNINDFEIVDTTGSMDISPTNESISVKMKRVQGWTTAGVFKLKVKPNTDYIFGRKIKVNTYGHGESTWGCGLITIKENAIQNARSLKEVGNPSREFPTGNGENVKTTKFNTGNCNYIGIFIKPTTSPVLENQLADFVISDLFLYESNIDSEYTPYKGDKKEIQLSKYGFDEGLRGLNNTVYDELNSIGDVAVKRVEKKVLNGDNEGWGVWTNSTGDVINAYVYFNDVIPSLKGRVKPDSICLNDRLPSNQGGHLSITEGFKITSTYFTLSIHKSKLGVENVNDPNNTRALKNWLNQNPITVYYELAEPVETPLDENINLKTFGEKTYITSDNIIKGDLSFTVPMNTAANLENNSSRLNTIEDYVDNNKDNISKISKLEEGSVTSSLNIIDLQKEIKNDNNYTHYEGSNISINNLSKDSRTSNMIIKGKTLKNELILTKFKKDFANIINLQDKKINFMNSYPVGTTRINLDQLKNNTTYTIIFNVFKLPKQTDFPIRITDDGLDYGISIKGINLNNTGLQKIVFSTKNNPCELIFYINDKNIDTVIDYPMILEGDWTNKIIPDYFEGIKSFGETEQQEDKYKISILSSGKNLLNINDFYNTLKSISNNGIFEEKKDGKDCIKITQLSNYWDKGYEKIKFKEKTPYTFSGTAFHTSDNRCILTIKYNDGSNVDISADANGWNKFNFTSDANKTIKGIFSAYTTDTWAYIDKNTFMIEEDERATNYEPYKEYKKDILIKEPLREGDYLYEDNGQVKVYRDVKQYTFTGDERITKENTLINITRFYIDTQCKNIVNTRNIMCNTFNSYGTWWDRDEIGMYWDTSIQGRLWFHIPKTKFNDVESFRNFLKANPTTIVYQLAESTTEIIENCVDTNLKTYKEKTYISCLNNIQGELSFDIPNNLVTQIKENTNNINNVYNSIDHINDKASKLESAQLSTALNVLELQKHTSMLDNGEVNEYKDYNGYLINCNNTLDSRTENMIIRGRTLQNIVKLSECPYAIGKPAGNNNNINTKDLVIKLKPLTTYNIKVDLTIPKTLDTELVFALIKRSPWTNKMQKGTGIKNSGEYIFDITTGSDVSEINAYTFVMTIEEYQSKGVTINNIIFLENEKNIETVNYFDGIKSVGEAELNQDKYKINLLSYSNNLLIDSEKTINGGGDRDEFMKYGDLAPIFDKHGLKKYTISFDLKSKDVSKNNIIQVYCQNGNGARYNIGNNNIEVTTEFKRYSVVVNPILVDSSDKYSYLAFYGVYGTGNSPIVKNVKVEEGEIISPLFESYIEDKKQILLKEPLHEKNYIYQDNNKIKLYKKKSKYVFTGDENWNLNSADTFTDTMQFWLNTSSFMDKYSEITCNNFTFVSNRINENGIEGISKIGGNNLNVWITINKEKLTTKDVEGFKRWLKNNPTEIIYDLATPTVETLDLIDINLDTYKNKTYITTNNKIPSKLEFKTQNNFGAIMKNVNRCISKIFNSLNNILNIKGE